MTKTGNDSPRLRVHRHLVAFIVMALCVIALVGVGQRAAADSPPAATPLVRVLPIDGAIGPALADFLTREIGRAPADGVDAIVLRMNTPGGLVTSMRDIVSAILASPVPVIGYVAPQGAHAASAGTYILYATHVAAMAPGTNLGAATPIEMGRPAGTPEKAPQNEEKGSAPPGAADMKAVNDLVALIKSLAELRGRNVEWGERAVREAATLTASEALKDNVIDLVAPDLDTLLSAADGRSVRTDGEALTLATANARIEHVEIGWASRFLMLITDPNIAFILMTLGMYGLIFELSNPGSILPGVLGTLCLIVALYGLSVLPVNVTGAALIGLGVALMLIEAVTPGFGVAGIGGIVSFALGATFLIDSSDPHFRLAPQTIFVVTAITAAFLVLVVGYALSAQGRGVITGRENILGRRAIVTEWNGGGAGFVQLDGERWQARSEEPLEPGSEVIVKGIDGLVLSIVRAVASKGKRSRRT